MRSPLKEPWKDYALRRQVRFGGPDLTVTYKKKVVGTVRVEYDDDTADVWRIRILRLDGTRITRYNREYRCSALDVFSVCVQEAVDELHKHVRV